MCIQHTVILSSFCKWKRPKWLFFVVKRYAVREAKKWRYAVRNAKIKRYAGGGGVTLWYLMHNTVVMFQDFSERPKFWLIVTILSLFLRHFRS